MNAWLIVLIAAVGFAITGKAIDVVTHRAPRWRRIARRTEYAFLLVICATGAVLIGLGYGDRTDAIWPACLAVAFLAHPPERFKVDAGTDAR